MTGGFVKIAVPLFLALILGIFVHPAAHAEVTHKKNVLVINSYHKGLSWTDNIVAGIESILKSETTAAWIELDFEYMDTKRYYDQYYLQKFFESFRAKYRKKHFDAVIVTDNDAFVFAQKHVQHLFPSVPVVFCGINGYDDSMIAGRANYTGVVEETDTKSTIAIALKLHPRARQFVVIGDQTTTGIAMKKEVLDVLPFFKDKVVFRFLDDFDFDELPSEIQALPSDSIILLTVVNRDRTGNFFAYEESVKIIAEASKVPIYSMWEFYLGKGLVGGMLTSGFQQGKSAAELALRILKGEKVSSVPLIRKSPNVYMFDYHELQRFGISMWHLPAGAVIINKPDTFYIRYKNTILIASAIILILSLTIVMLLINIFTRKRYEKALRLSEEKYRDLYDNAPDMYHSVDRNGVILECNETEAKMLGYKKGEIIGRSIADFQTKESLKNYQKELPTLANHAALFGLEREFIRKDGTTFPVTQNVFTEVDEKGELVRTKTIGRDMTERKRVETALRNSREELRSLSAHMQSALEEERRHIAREIHDELGQTLSKLKLDITWLKKRMSKDQKPLVEKADRMSYLVDGTIRMVQRIASELRPGVLDYLGLPAAIEWQAKEFREQTGIRCAIEIASDISVEDQRVSIAVFRIFQETLTNIIRHAKASRAVITLKQEDNTIVLAVGDNGVGIPEGKLTSRDSFGLMGIKERVRFLNGKVNIVSAPRQGTTVTVRIPLDGKVGL